MSLLGWVAGAYVVSRIIKKEKKWKQPKDNSVRELLNSLESNYEDDDECEEEYDEEDDEDYEYGHKNVQIPFIPCRFEDGFSEEAFRILVKNEAKKIKRIKSIEERGGRVRGFVRSQSGISDWEFIIDFNYAGHITGSYSIASDNTESTIPSRLAENIASAIPFLIARSNAGGESTTRNESFGLYCPYCGEFTPGRNIKFCFYCGKPRI